MAVYRARRGVTLLLLLTAGVLCRLLSSISFVCGPTGSRGLRGHTAIQAAAGPDKTAAPAAAPAKVAETKTTAVEDVDDAVLKMAMAMAEEEEGGAPVKPVQEKKEEEEGFDFNIIIQLFWISLIVYSFGSAFIGIAQGRIQDRTGGDFTAYDFFDNIFSFRDWDLEYTLGFDPIKVFNDLTGKTGN